MSASEKLKTLEQRHRDFDPMKAIWNEPLGICVDVLNALPQIVAIIEGIEGLPMLLDVIEGSTIKTISFVPLLDELDKALS